MRPEHLAPLEERERRAVIEVINIRLLVDERQAAGADKAETERFAERAIDILRREATLPGQHDRLLTMCDAMYAVTKTLKTLSPKNRQITLDRVTNTFLRTGSILNVDAVLRQCVDEMDAAKKMDPRKYERQYVWAKTVWGHISMRDWIGTERHKALVVGVGPMLSVDDATAELIGELTAELEAENRVADNRVQAWNQGKMVIEEVVPFFAGTLHWARASFPVFSLTDDFFHALAVTDFGTHEDDKADVLHLPFPSFMLNFPPNTVLDDARKLFVFRFRAMTCLALVTTNHTLRMEWPLGISRWELSHGAKWKSDLTAPEKVDLLDMARRILANMLSYIDASNGLPREKHKHGAPAAPVEREHTEPRFRVGRTVKLSPQIRQVLKEGKSGTHWKLGHRFIVRGHFRNQAHGPNRSLRTRKWIEPHWKGPATMTEAFERSYSVE